MKNKNEIVFWKEIYLGDKFAEITDKIFNDPIYEGLLRICEFDESRKILGYKTEALYPEPQSRIPVLFLFSNPYPGSVENGLFHSDSTAQSFWACLFETDYIKLPPMPPDDTIDTSKIGKDQSTRDHLAQLMLDGHYRSLIHKKESPFIIYFHCLETIPTLKPEHLKQLFKSAPEIWNQLKSNSMKCLETLSKNQSVEDIIVFSKPTFLQITGTDGNGLNNWREIVRQARDNNTPDELWGLGGSAVAKAKFSEEVNVYLALDTRLKNDGKVGGKSLFTWALDQIFINIILNHPSRQANPQLPVVHTSDGTVQTAYLEYSSSDMEIRLVGTPPNQHRIFDISHIHYELKITAAGNHYQSKGGPGWVLVEVCRALSRDGYFLRACHNCLNFRQSGMINDWSDGTEAYCEHFSKPGSDKFTHFLHICHYWSPEEEDMEG
jgi:hypothetical protein